MVAERKNHRRMGGIMPRSKYDLNHITNIITENYIQLKEISLKQVVYSLFSFKNANKVSA